RDTSSYLKKLLKIYLTFEAVELIIYTAPLLMGGITVPVLIRRFFTVGIGCIYWYLISLIITLLILRPLWKKGIIIPGIIIGLILYLFMMTNDSYSVLFTGTMIQKYAIMHTNFWTWPQAGLCSSILFVSIGALLKKHDIDPPLILVILSVILLIIEALIMQAMKPYDGNGYLALMISAPLLFSFALHHPLSTKYRYFGELSLYVYMIHPFFNNILGLIVRVNSLRFIVVAICTVTLSYLIVRRHHKDTQTIK
ncbi:MAG: hypothetical protein J6P61_02920, partial [Erysipelotrichaceae bacterium]|nr:hypothetical protein [Erysipelotrichaceae bacterium]